MSENPRVPLLSLRQISLRFGAVEALVGVDLDVYAHQVVALVGDNGAGKSTLLKCLLGVTHPDSGRVIVEGNEVAFESPRDARAHGIECVYQDLALAPDLAVVDNMFLGHEATKGGLRRPFGVLARREMAARADDALRRLSIKLPSLSVPISDLSGGQRQALAVARAVMWARTAVLMDEPTAALGARQSEIVCDLMRQVAARGLAVLVVSHDLPRILKVAHRVVVLWRGETAFDLPADELTVPDVVAAMVGFQKGATTDG